MMEEIDEAFILPRERVLPDHDECVVREIPEPLRAKAVRPPAPRKPTVAAPEPTPKKRKRRDEVAELKRLRTAGAIVAPSRTNEGYPLATGDRRTCLVDAVVNGARKLGVSVSLSRLRSLAIPELGNEPQASWASVQHGLATLGAPLALVEASRRFYAGGPPMLALLGAPPGVYVVRIEAVIDGV